MTLSNKSYKSQESWRKIQQFLPPRLHFTPEHAPVEEWWQSHGHSIHLDRWRNPDAKVRVILHHGIGTNGRQMSVILGVPLHAAGFELVAIDMPGYGCTKANGVYSYDDWVRIAVDFIDHELQNDPRPIVLYGLSAGGMLAYHAAAISKKVSGIVAMCFLNQRNQQCADTTARNVFMSRVGVPMARLCNNFLLKGLSVPMALPVKMSTLVNDPDALRVFLADKTSAGSWASMRFLSTYMSYEPAIEPEQFDVCPILLTQPAEDRWSPRWISELFLSRVQKVPVKRLELENAGHYPLEDPGLRQMADVIIDFLRSLPAV